MGRVRIPDFIGPLRFEGGWRGSKGLNSRQINIPVNPLQSPLIPLVRGLTEQYLMDNPFVNSYSVNL